MMLFCLNNKNPAKRRYLQGSVGVAVSYIGLVFASRILVNRWHPQGWHLYLAAALPSISLLCFAWVVGRYLREERDDYQRDVLVRAMLWGTAAALAITVFSGFLRSYGWQGELPPFIEFIVFWAVAAVAKFTYFFANRATSNE